MGLSLYGMTIRFCLALSSSVEFLLIIKLGTSRVKIETLY